MREQRRIVHRVMQCVSVMRRPCSCEAREQGSAPFAEGSTQRTWSCLPRGWQLGAARSRPFPCRCGSLPHSSSCLRLPCLGAEGCPRTQCFSFLHAELSLVFGEDKSGRRLQQAVQSAWRGEASGAIITIDEASFEYAKIGDLYGPQHAPFWQRLVDNQQLFTEDGLAVAQKALKECLAEADAQLPIVVCASQCPCPPLWHAHPF